jgi:hypothetical protein
VPSIRRPWVGGWSRWRAAWRTWPRRRRSGGQRWRSSIPGCVVGRIRGASSSPGPWATRTVAGESHAAWRRLAHWLIGTWPLVGYYLTASAEVASSLDQLASRNERADLRLCQDALQLTAGYRHTLVVAARDRLRAHTAHLLALGRADALQVRACVRGGGADSVRGSRCTHVRVRGGNHGVAKIWKRRGISVNSSCDRSHGDASSSSRCHAHRTLSPLATACCLLPLPLPLS